MAKKAADAKLVLHHPKGAHGKVHARDTTEFINSQLDHTIQQSTEHYHQICSPKD